MKGDFSRSTFDRTKHYSRVLMQQGRVQLDADWNEEQEIGFQRDVRTTRDEIGGCGVPSSVPDSFKIAIDSTGTDLTIAPGRMYVSGILCENEAPASLLKQPDLPSATLDNLPGFKGKPGKGIYLAYLDVWQRHITALEDPTIREKALGGPDTATRVKTVWQVKLRLTGDRGAPVTCANAKLPSKPGTGALTASIATSGVAGPCVLPPQTGYRRLENQLYRVEVHTPGKIGEATFKWSRENGSVVAAITGTGGSWTIPVQSTGRDSELGFAPGNWVEMLDDSIELSGNPGALFQVAKIDPAARTIELKPSGATPSFDPALHPKLRLWNQQGGTEVATGVPVTAAAIALEDGLQVQFSGAFFATGDYWLIPARTAIDNTIGNIEWPVDATNNPAAVAPYRIDHWYCALAILDFDGEKFQPINGAVPDCREPFDDLVTLTKRRSSGCCTVSVGPEDLKGNTTLQTILDQWRGKGRVAICLKPGIYTLPGTLRLDKGHAGFIIEGCPGGAILRGAEGPQEAFADGLIALTNTSNIKIQKLRLELPLSPYPATALAKTAISSIGIRALDCTNLSVTNCEFAAPTFGERLIFAAGIFGGGMCTGWTIANNQFLGASTDATATRLPQVSIGILIHPALQGTAAPPTTTTNLPPRPPVLRAATGDTEIIGNNFEALSFAVLTTADSGNIRCSENDAAHCTEGFWFLSLAALSLLSPDQEITIDPQYEDELAGLLNLFGLYFQDQEYSRTFYFALFYPTPQGWALEKPDQPAAPDKSKRSLWQTLVDRSVNAIRNSLETAPAPATAKVKVSDFVKARADNAFSFLSQAINLEPTLSLSLDFSNNTVDLGTGRDQLGTGLLVVDSDRTTDSVLTVTSNRMRNYSSLTSVASAWSVDRVAITGNIITNARATPGASGSKRTGGPWSLVLVPLQRNEKVQQAYAISGNVFLGTTTLPLIQRPFAAPMNTWSFVNTEL